MLSELVLRNYRGFRHHTIPLRSKTIIIGANNAGKTTAVEALRLLSVVVNRFTRLSVVDMSDETGIRELEACVVPSLRGTNVDLSHVCHQYGDPPAIIKASFEEGYQISVYLTPDNHIFGVIRDSVGRVYRNRYQASHFRIPPINVLPQVRPLLIDESIRDDRCVRSSMTTDLAPLHFRNQLRLFDEHYADFAAMAEATWPGLRIRQLDIVQAEGADALLSLLIQDGRFVAEVGRMGHGLQIWLQTIWFLARSQPNETLILDEPDVYLHADLQRRLVRHLVSRPNQIIMTTHAIDVLSEVTPEQILVIDKTRRNSSFTASIPAVQTVVERIGSVQNIQLARLWNAKRLLHVEGDHIYLLKCFQDIVFPETKSPLDALPNMSIGGWGGWSYIVGSSILLKNALDEEILSYCILDSDYHTEDEIQARYEDARRRGVRLHIWKRKEIENYLLVPEAIRRAMWDVREDDGRPGVEEIGAYLDRIMEQLKDTIVDALVEARLQVVPRRAYKAVIGGVRDYADENWVSLESRSAVAPGKEVIARLFQAVQADFGVSLTQGRVARAFTTMRFPTN